MKSISITKLFTSQRAILEPSNKTDKTIFSIYMPVKFALFMTLPKISE